MQVLCRTMIAASLLAASVAPVVIGASEPLQRSGPSNEKMVEIDGAKDPSAIPFWLVWGTTFRLIHAVPNGTYPAMGLSPAETELVVTAADEAVDADATCNRRITERIDAWKAEGKSPVETYPENKTLIIACRQIQLDLADRLLEKLSAESRPKLLAFANDRRKGIVSLVPEAELEFYRRPR